jgi:hypothetical protein
MFNLAVFPPFAAYTRRTGEEAVKEEEPSLIIFHAD